MHRQDGPQNGGEFRDQVGKSHRKNDMTDWPNLCILLLTYNRLEFATKTVRSVLENLHYSGQLRVHIADDGSDEEYRESLRTLVGGYSNVVGVGVSNSERRGYGANYNLAMQAVHSHSRIVLPLEDDWQLTAPFDLDPLVKALGEEYFGCIRLGYLGLTQSLSGEFILANGIIWLLLNPDSPEPHVFAGHPRLETVDWEKAVGPWPEDLDPNTTEFAVCHQPEAREGVVWPVSMLTTNGGLFAHIGSYEAGEGRVHPKEEVLA